MTKLLTLPLLAFSLFAASPVGAGEIDPHRKAEKMVILPRKEIEMLGWTLRVDERLMPGGEMHEEIGARALSLVKTHLGRIIEVVPPAALAELRKVPIVLDEHPQLVPAQYHPSSEWLKDHLYDPSLGECVQISRASFFISPERVQWQQAVVLHELAHAYHHQVLGHSYEPVEKAFANAEASGIYEDVLHASGKMTRHYALTNSKEFFAEATEAWFAANDFYPFVRAELRRHDPETYEAIEKAWFHPFAEPETDSDSK
ncbi:MAG: metallopeptidase [Verrucomicrobiota bacterium JB023]|nr:metallopeptidase [Verrucomicrobiota bacterium JB023]